MKIASPSQVGLLKDLGASLSASAYKNLGKLDRRRPKPKASPTRSVKAEAYRDKVVPAMKALRIDVDGLEAIVPKDLWPVPSYADLLFKL